MTKMFTSKDMVWAFEMGKRYSEFQRDMFKLVEKRKGVNVTGAKNE